MMAGPDLIELLQTLAAWAEALGTWAAAFFAAVAVLVTACAALGTFLAVFVALAGDHIKSHWFGPRLKLDLNSVEGDLYPTKEGPGLFFHIRVTNTGRTAATLTKVLVKKLERRTGGEPYRPEPLHVPVQLHWAYSLSRPLEPGLRVPTIGAGQEAYCDLGALFRHIGEFTVSNYENPENFRGFVWPGEYLRVHLYASAENYQSRSAFVVEVHWDGTWADDTKEMQKHLVVKRA
jgi:hypothetical protein